MSTTLPCVLMRAGTSRGPFFLREWLPADEALRDQMLIGAIGASDPLQLDGVGGGSTLNSKVAIVSRSTRPGCDLDYLFAQVGVGQRSVDTRPNCGNMLSGVLPFAIEQGLIEAGDGSTTACIFNVNTGSRIEVTVRTPGRRVTYEGDARIDGVAGTAAPIHLNFLDAWGAVTGQVFPTGRRIDRIDGTELTCIDAAMPLMIVRARDLGLSGRESPVELDADARLLDRLEALRRAAGEMMGLGDVSNSVIPKPVLVSDGDDADSITSRYFTPRRCHASHAVTGAIGVASAFALPGTVASGRSATAGTRQLVVLHPAGRIDIEVEIDGSGDAATIRRASLVRTARKILQGELHIPDYVLSSPRDVPAAAKPITIVVPTSAGGANDAMSRTIAQRLAPLLGQAVIVDNRAGANGSIASEFVARAAPDGQTLMLGYIGTHAMNPALQALRYDPVADFAPIGLVARSPTLMVAHAATPVDDVKDLIAQLKARPDKYSYASAGHGTAPHFAAELFKLSTRTEMLGLPHQGAAPAIDDTVAGRTQLMFPSLFTADPFVKAGRLRALAVAGPKRIASLPGVPTLKEAGVEGVEVPVWYALLAPAAAPREIVTTLGSATARAARSPDTKQRLVEQGADPVGNTPEEFAKLLRTEVVKYAEIVRISGAKPE